jgi:hypothetical protein
MYENCAELQGMNETCAELRFMCENCAELQCMYENYAELQCIHEGCAELQCINGSYAELHTHEIKSSFVLQYIPILIGHFLLSPATYRTLSNSIFIAFKPS